MFESGERTGRRGMKFAMGKGRRKLEIRDALDKQELK
jgi:hypothetical protein